MNFFCSTIADDSDVIEEHSSVKHLLAQSGHGDAGTLEECFDLYTRAEVLGAEDKWHCPYCNRKQEVIKKLGLWSLPDILVIHLKRFRQVGFFIVCFKVNSFVTMSQIGT